MGQTSSWATKWSETDKVTDGLIRLPSAIQFVDVIATSSKKNIFSFSGWLLPASSPRPEVSRPAPKHAEITGFWGCRVLPKPRASCIHNGEFGAPTADN